jgi:hypothetical protein
MVPWRKLSTDDRRPLIWKPWCLPDGAHRQAQGSCHQEPRSLQQLQRQMAYDRLLERLYLVDEGWIIKGGTALFRS